MILASAQEHLRPELKEPGRTPAGRFDVSHLIRPRDQSSAQAYIAESTSFHARSDPHFHIVDQFQLFIDGGGTFQRHEIVPVMLHYTDAYSTYGPFEAGDDGLTFAVLRCLADPGAKYMPGSRDELVGRPGRNFQIELPQPVPGGSATTPTCVEIAHHDDGLGVILLELGPGQTTSTPDPAGSAGQYLFVLRGSIELDGASLDPWSCVHLDATDSAPSITAGSGGCAVVVMAFPRPRGETVTAESR
jgi:hypothetical protein